MAKRVERYWIAVHPDYIDVVHDDSEYKIIFTGWREEDEDDEPTRRIVLILSDDPRDVLQLLEAIENKLVALLREEGVTRHD